jgi:hypothetical protein
VLAFGDENIRDVGEALDVAEDVTGNFYKLSTEQWKRHPYDVKTLASLTNREIIPSAFAVLHKGVVNADHLARDIAKRDVYFICLQDDRILWAVDRDKDIRLFPLLVYVLTHELVHIVRFSKFVKRFESSGKSREDEESIVHATTHEILQRISLPRLDKVLDLYRDHRICHLIGSPC